MFKSGDRFDVELTGGRIVSVTLALLDGDTWQDTESRNWSVDFLTANRVIGGRKDDADKPPYHLIAPELIFALAEILDFGQKKYSPRNWEKGMAWHRPFRACIGHMWDWWRGAGPDAETGKSHLWHAACCIMFLVAYEARGIGEDDRPKL